MAIFNRTWINTGFIMPINDDQANQLYDVMYQIFGNNLPHPITEPKRFAYYVKLYKHLVRINYN